MQARRYRGNDFLARPTKFAGEVTMGVREYPGFHTAESRDTTYAYAQQKAVSEFLDTDVGPDEAADATIDDYPVVITLDMKGMQAHVDYDAVKMVKPTIVDVAKQIMQSREVKEGKRPIEELAFWVEAGEMEAPAEPNNAVEYLFQQGSAVTHDPSGALLMFAEEHDDPDAFIAALAKGQLPDEALAAITGQYRYVDDVPTSRVIAVEYFAPWWPDITDAEMRPEDEDLIMALDAAGWIVIDRNDVFGGMLGDRSKEVYSRPEPKRARIEYHGTSYRNLVSAAPELDLPVPPRPFAG